MILAEFAPGEAFQEYVALPLAVNATEASASGAAENASAGATLSRVYNDEQVTREYLVPELPYLQCRYAERVDPIRAKLLYFFIQAPAPDAPAGTIVRIAPTLQESLGRVREVTYDRGTVVDELAREASRMSAASERLRSFKDSTLSRFVSVSISVLVSILAISSQQLCTSRSLCSTCFCRKYEAEEALTLACLGLFIPATSAQTDYRVVKCSFCRRSFTFGSRFAEFKSYSTVDSRIAKLLWRHSVLCSKCPIAIGLNCDNRALDINVINHYLYNHFGSAIPNAGFTL